MTNKELYYKIIREGGVYDARKYRYDIDTDKGVVRRTELSNLDTTAMLDKDAWKTLFKIESVINS